MRFIVLLLSVSPSFVFADTIVARIVPTDVTVFTQGAEVTRKGKITLPAGIHDIVIPDMRPTLDDFPAPEITLPNATLISGKWQDETPTPRADPETVEYKAAKKIWILRATPSIHSTMKSQETYWLNQLHCRRSNS